MALRFIVKRSLRDQGYVASSFETLDVECPELEQLLTRGGYGGGPDNEDFDHTTLVGVEVKRAE